MRRWRGIACSSGLACALLAGMAGAQDGPPVVANGVFLVAKPALDDPRFAQTVVLVTLPADGGAIGVIVNRALGRKLSELVPEPEGIPPDADALHYGGPVATGQLLMLVQTSSAPPGSFRVLDDVYLSTDPQLLQDLRAGALPGARVRFYAGYAGWAPGQLQAEVRRGSWWIVPADAASLFERDPATLWETLRTRASMQGARLRAPMRHAFAE
jgi:putative transcriptional regulator